MAKVIFESVSSKLAKGWSNWNEGDIRSDSVQESNIAGGVYINPRQGKKLCWEPKQRSTSFPHINESLKIHRSKQNKLYNP